MDDELLRGLGRHQREDLERSEVGWDATDELLEPFDDETRERMLDAVFERVDAAPEAEAEPVASAEPPEPPSRPPAPVIELAARRPGRIGVVGGLLVAAAAAAVLVIWWSRGTTLESDRAVAMLPEYTTSQLRGGAASHRSEPNSKLDSVSLGARDELDWVITPAEPVAGPITLALLAVPEVGQAIFVPEVRAEISGPGAIRLRGRLDGFVDLAPGSWTLTLMIAPPGQLPVSLEQARSSEPAAWQRASVRVTIIPDP